MQKSNIKATYNQNLILGQFNMLLARNLALATFMDVRSEIAQKRCFKTYDTAYNEGTIISIYDTRSRSIPESVPSSVAVPGNIDLEKRDFGINQWRNFMSVISAKCRKFFIV